MIGKPRPNDERYLEVLRSMSPVDRLRKAVELTEMARTLFLVGLKQRFPDKTEQEIHELYLKRLSQCHNSGC